MATDNRDVSGVGPSEQYSQASENSRYYGGMRFTQLTLYGVISTLILNAAISKQPQEELSKEHSNLTVFSFVGMAATAVVWIMEIRSTVSEHYYQHVARSFESGLASTPVFPMRSVILTATNAVVAFYAGSYLGWFLLWHSQRPALLGEWALAVFLLLLGACLLVYTIRLYFADWQRWQPKVHSRDVS